MSNPDPSGVKLVIESDEDFSFVLEALAELEGTGSYQGRLLALTAQTAMGDIKRRMVALEKARDALIAEHNKLRAMLNTNQARAQSAAQSAAKIAQEFQVYLREHVVKLEV
jgi:hypothetical protein